MKNRFYLYSFLAILCFSLFSSCEKPYCDQVQFVFTGSQEENGFGMHIHFYVDQSRPVRVWSGRIYSADRSETDVEYLTCRYTEDGFVLCDPKTGTILYTAVYLESAPGILVDRITIKWTHSPGIAWDANAEKSAWQREMVLFKGFLGEG